MKKIFRAVAFIGLIITLSFSVQPIAAAETTPKPADPGHLWVTADNGPKFFEGMDFYYGENANLSGGPGIEFNTHGTGWAVEVGGGYVLPEFLQTSILGENLRIEGSWNYSGMKKKGSFGSPAMIGVPMINGGDVGVALQLGFPSTTQFNSKEVYWGLEMMLQTDYTLWKHNDRSIISFSPFTGVTFTERTQKIEIQNFTQVTNFHNNALIEKVHTDYVGWKFGGIITAYPCKRLALFYGTSLSVLGAISDFSGYQNYQQAMLADEVRVEDSDRRATVQGVISFGANYDVWGWATAGIKAELELWQDVPYIINPIQRGDQAAHLGMRSLRNWTLFMTLDIPLGRRAQELQEEAEVVEEMQE